MHDRHGVFGFGHVKIPSVVRLLGSELIIYGS